MTNETSSRITSGLKPIHRYLLLIFSAVLMSLSFHPIGLHFLAWFGLVPLLFAIEKTAPLTTFISGIIFGFCFSLFALFWLVFLQIDTQTKLLMLFGLLLMFFYLSMYFATGVLIANEIGIWSLPCALTGLEFVRSLGELGFPWLSLGYSQARYPLLLQTASLTGVFGITLWLTVINVLAYLTIRKKQIHLVFVTLAVFFLPVFFGMLRMKPQYGNSFIVGIIQPNIDPNLKFTRAMRDETFRRLIDLSEKCASQALYATGDSADLIVWPETATPIFLHLPGTYQEQVYNLVNRISTPVFTGTPVYDANKHLIYNGAVLIEKDRGISQEYKKLHLVPFGEHIPFDQHIGLLKNVDVGGGNYTPGTEYTIFWQGNVRFSCLICFESIFPDLSRTFVKQGADFLVNITNDGWFGSISGPQQHNDMAILRAVEDGVPLIRCSNTGISMVVDPYGRVIAETDLFKETYIIVRVVTGGKNTLYTYTGDILPFICLLLITVLMTYKIIRKIKQRYPEYH